MNNRLKNIIDSEVMSIQDTCFVIEEYLSGVKGVFVNIDFLASIPYPQTHPAYSVTYSAKLQRLFMMYLSAHNYFISKKK